MKKLFIAFIFTTIGAYSQQYKSVEIGVDGLTCSMCTRSTELNIRKLSFVDSVAMDLSNTKGVIFFKKNTEVNLEKIANAVFDAGFSLRYFKAEFFNLNNIDLKKGTCFTYQGSDYKYIGNEEKTISGDIKMTLIGKKFMHTKDFKKWSEATKIPCATDKKTYYVSL